MAAVISGQIDAFRQHDSKAALSFAGASLQQTFTDPEQFYAAIINMGAWAIATSRSHSFGEFQMLGGVGVLQQVI